MLKNGYKQKLILMLAMTMISQTTVLASQTSKEDLVIMSEESVTEQLNNITQGFVDTQGHWAKKTIDKWYNAGIINGVGDNKFNPDEAMARKDLAIIIDKVLALSKVYGEESGDSKYYTNALNRLVKEGIMSSERPDDTITRQEAAIVICKAFGIEPSDDTIDKLDFKDKDEVAFWSEPYILAVKQAGIMNGTPDGLIMPTKGLTRAEMVTMINKALGHIEKSGQIYEVNTEGTDEAVYVSNEKETKIFKSNLDSVISASDVNICNSTIQELTQRNSKAVMEIDGHVYNLNSYNAIVGIAGGTIRELRVYGVNNEIKQDITGIGRVVMKPKSALKLPSGQIVVNNNDVEITYTSNDLRHYIKRDKQDIRLNLMSDNTLEITSISGESTQAMIRRNGIVPGNSLGTEFISVPTRINVEPGQVIIVRSCDIASDGTGKASNIGEPVAVEAYNFDFSMKIDKTGIETDSFDEDINTTESNLDTIGYASNLGRSRVTAVTKNIKLNMVGKKLPDIDKLEILSASDKIDTGVYKATEAKLISNEGNIVKINKVYAAEVVFNADKNGMISMNRYYGFRITDKNGNVNTVYPVMEDDSIPSNQVKSIRTGDATIENDIMTISDNRMSIETGVLFETGIAYKTISVDEHLSGVNIPTVVDNTWNIKKGSGKGTEISVDLLGEVTEKVIYYTFYTKTDSGYTYGEIKDIVGQTAPIISSAINVNSGLSSKYATVGMGILSSSDIDLDKSRVIELIDSTGKNVIENMTLKDLGGSYKNEYLMFTLGGLEKNKEYSLKIDLSNEYSTLKNIDILFDTSK